MAAVTIVGLGPAGLERVADRVVVAVLDPSAQVILRTAHHPSCEQIAAMRSVTVCDDLYDSSAAFDDVYAAIADRVISAAANGPVVYGVPGSAVVGERAVRMIRNAAAAEGMEVDVHPGESFLDLVWVRTGCDPIADGAQVLDGRVLPDPLLLHLPTVVTQVDRPEVLADVVIALGRTLADATPVMVLDALAYCRHSILRYCHQAVQMSTWNLMEFL